MKLKKCYIENFGTLHDFSYEFKRGLNTIQQENGWGKTTFGVFIKAMFYGLEYSPNKKIADNERKKYMPWQGGNFGGSLEFELDGKEYKIERFFGARDKDDLFRLYDLQTGLASKAYTENIGEEIFHIDRSSYERSTYIPQNGIAIGMTDSINAKLSNLIENGNDINNYETAYSKLEEHMKEYKRRGGKGRIPELREQISKVQVDIDECKNKAMGMELVAEQIEQQKELRAEFERRRETLKEEILKASAAKEQAAKRSHYDSLKKRAAEIEVQKKEYDEIFAGGLPEESQIEQIESEITAVQELQNAKVLAQLNEEEERQLNELDDFFANGCPDSPEIEMYLGESRQSSGIKDEIIGIESKLEVLAERQEQEKARLQAEQELRTRARQAQYEASKMRADMIRRILLPSGILMLAGGIFLYILNQPAAYALFVLAVILIIAIAFVKPQEKPMTESVDTDDVDTDELRQLSVQMEELKADLVRLAARKQEMHEHYDIFVKQFPVNDIDEDPTQTLMEIKTKALEYQNLTNRGAERSEQNEQISAQVAQKNARIHALLQGVHEKYVQHDDLRKACGELNEDRKEYLWLIEEYQKSQDEVRQFEESNAEVDFAGHQQLAGENQTEDVVSLEALQEQEKENELEIENINGKINSYRKDMDTLGVIADKQSDFEAELETLRNQLTEAEAHCDMLEKTMHYLKEAKESFSTHYMGNMRRGFVKYASRMGQDLAHQIQLDIQLEAQLAVGGSLKGSESFSAGNRDFIGICIRLALVEALFETEKPFIILDDPFVNLDDHKVENAKRLLTEIAEDYQIIYLVCHSSRS